MFALLTGTRFARIVSRKDAKGKDAKERIREEHTEKMRLSKRIKNPLFQKEINLRNPANHLIPACWQT